MTGLSTTKLLAGVAAVAVSLGVPATANATHLKHHRRVVRIVAPVPAVVENDNPLYVPGERNDPDLGSTPADSLALGRERPFLSSEDVARQFGIAPSPGFELEGPPIGPSLPVIR